MDGSKKKNKHKPIFESIRKPTAPASQKFDADKPQTKIDPVRRKAKHKKRYLEVDRDADI